jgi:exodeoxyribonuclease-3
MRIATWNINGVKARLGLLLTWLQQHKPDIVVLQEIKSVDEGFPRAEIEALGYNVATHGQKSWNGVAILSLLPLDEVTRGLPGDDGDEQARLIEAVVSVESGALRVCGIYLPNGNPVDSEKFPYKLNWMERLERFVGERLEYEEPFVLLGDFNIIPAPADAHDPEAWWGDALFRPESLERFRRIVNLGLTDAVRATTDGGSLHLLGLPGRRLAAQCRHPHRPHPALAAGGGPAGGRAGASRGARLGQAERPRAGGSAADALRALSWRLSLLIPERYNPPVLPGQ